MPILYAAGAGISVIVRAGQNVYHWRISVTLSPLTRNALRSLSLCPGKILMEEREKQPSVITKRRKHEKRKEI